MRIIQCTVMKLEALLLLLMVTAVVAEGTCLKKYFDQDSFVCVCNDDHCDFYNPLGPIPEGEAYLVTSDKAERRLKEQKRSFQETSSKKFGEGLLEFLVKQDEVFQSVLGFGGSFTDAVGRNIYKMSEKLQDDILR